MVIEKIGRLPVNSRIFIDYTKIPPQIDFEYPDTRKSNIRRGDITYFFSMVTSIIILLIMLGGYTFWIQPWLYPSIDDTEIQVNQIVISDFEYPNGTHYGFNSILVNYTWNNKTQKASLDLTTQGIIILKPYFYDKINSFRYYLPVILEGISLFALFIILTILNSYWIAKLFTDTSWGNKKFPELNKKLHDKRYSAEFFPEDFPQNGNTIEIPLFKNMYMDYEATEDFSKYLEKISIIEHPFNRFIKKGIFRKKELKEKNISLWKTVFQFKEGIRPKTGRLILRWT